MIYFILTGDHCYTTEGLTAESAADSDTPATLLRSVAPIPYPDLLMRDAVPRGTYVFGDMERLGDAGLVMASDLYRALREAPGCRVLNDPARVRFRYGLLRALNEAGLNGFDTYRADGFPRPKRFPVFVRSEAAHDAPVSALIEDQAVLDATLADLERRGQPLRGLIVIEYAAEPAAEGVFRRYGTFRVGERVLLDNVVSEDSWNVKHGKPGLATEEMYRQDARLIAENAYADTLARAFDLGGIDYGRADFGLVGGRPQIYEINTNPYIGPFKPHASAVRKSTMACARKRLVEALEAIELPEDGPPVRLESEALRAHRAAFRRSPLGHARERLEEAEQEVRRLSAELARRPVKGRSLIERARRLVFGRGA